MALRYRRVKEISRFLAPLVFPGNCNQQFGNAYNLVGLSAQKQFPNWVQGGGSNEHRFFSTMADLTHEPAPEIDILSFIKASLDELEGTHHCWLNRSDKSYQHFGGGGIFLVLASTNFDCVMFEKLKRIQKRYKKDMFPHIFIMTLNSIHSSVDGLHLARLLMRENITVPILLSQWAFPEIEKEGYILFKSFSGPVICHEKDVDLEILYLAVQELQMQPNGDSTLLNLLRSTSWKQNGIPKDQYTCFPLQNLLLSYPGCISADESANRLFFSDCNHHRIIISDGNGEILDCIGSSPGFEDGDFGFAKLGRPAGSYYDTAEDCLFFVDSENHAIRKADLGARSVETLYPASPSKKGVGIWSWVMSRLGLESSQETSVEETSEAFDSKSLYFPWHLLKSDDDTLYIIDRRFQTLWTFDLGSGKIDEVFEGSARIIEICGQQIMKNLSILDQIPCDWFQQQSNDACLLEGLSHFDRLSSLTTFQNHIFICDTVGQGILKVSRESGVCSKFKFSNLGILGLPYWFNYPLETFYAGENGLLGTQIDHLQHFELRPGRIDMRLSVDIPIDVELVEPLQESCIWRQARGAATEISGIDDKPGSSDKVGVAQRWYDEFDDLLSLESESEIAVEEDIRDTNLVVKDDKVRINCGIFTSPGTSEVIIYGVLYFKLRRLPNSNEGNPEKYAARILDILGSKRCGKTERDLWKSFLLQSKGDLRDLIFMKSLHIRIRLNCLDHPKATNGRDYLLTDSSIEVNVTLN